MQHNLAFLVFASLILVAGTGSAGSGATDADTVSIPLTPNGAPYAPLIKVSIGGGPYRSVEFDTGSSGLRVLESALGGATYTDTGKPIANVFGDRVILTGTVGTADVNVGGIDIGKPVTFQIVKQISCFAGRPCKPEVFLRGTSGIFGARPRVAADGLLYSLMSELPGNLSSGYIVSLAGTNPRLQVGINAANSANFQTYPVATSTLPDGAPIWDPRARGGLFPWCYTITVGTVVSGPSCPSPGILTDSGGLNMVLYLPATPPPSVKSATLSALPTGARITATLGNITWNLPLAGNCPGRNEVFVWFGGNATPPPAAGSTSGINPFFTNDVLFDVKGGRFGLRPAYAEMPVSFC